jgi:DNA topoisomerase-3
VYEFPCEIFGKPALFKVTSVTGHIYVADFPSEYQDWRTVDPLSLFEAPTIKKEANPEV